MELLEELEEVLGIASYPMNWPIGMGRAFEGLYDLHNKRLELYKGEQRFADLEEGARIFASNPFMSRCLKILSSWRRQVMTFQSRLF